VEPLGSTGAPARAHIPGGSGMASRGTAPAPFPAMRKMLMHYVAAVVLTAPLMGCLVTTAQPGRGRHVQEASGRPACHPSQYWDGETCRHKGRGHGARKHDGRR